MSCPFQHRWMELEKDQIMSQPHPALQTVVWGCAIDVYSLSWCKKEKQKRASLLHFKNCGSNTTSLLCTSSSFWWSLQSAQTADSLPWTHCSIYFAFSQWLRATAGRLPQFFFSVLPHPNVDFIFFYDTLPIRCRTSLIFCKIFFSTSSMEQCSYFRLGNFMSLPHPHLSEKQDVFPTIHFSHQLVA